ncbi:cytochrome P450 2 sub U member 1 [Bulinus truncatus]|nr:cytochrome P450 2 sub U member 1 [Bulinus truncatus]
MPFGLGRRVCIGESMAKTELFLCLGSMIQRFQLLPEDPLKPPPLKYISGLTIAPEVYMSNRSLPPSPMWSLPVVGHFLFLNKDLRPDFQKWRNQCGDIFSLQLGSKLMIVLNGYDVIHEALVTRGDDFSDRPVILLDELLGSQGKGIVFSSGSVWNEHRALSLGILRKFGLGTDALANRITSEVTHLLNHLAEHIDQPVDIGRWTTTSTASAADGKNVCVQQSNFNFELHALLKYLPRDVCNERQLKKILMIMSGIFQQFIDESKDKDPEDSFIASYVHERESRLKSGQETSLDDANLLKSVFDLFLAGTETTSVTLSWFVLYMLNYPDIQLKIFQEISQCVGMHRSPTMQDKSKLIYVNAAIMETQRLSSILPQSVSRTCSSDQTIRNFTIPKGSLIAPNLDSVLLDEKIWGDDAKSFRPERFIDEVGQLKKIPEFVPFGLVRRVCLGEALAKTELFITLTAMVQRFELSPVDPAKPASMNYVYGLTCRPQPYLVQITERKQV